MTAPILFDLVADEPETAKKRCCRCKEWKPLAEFYCRGTARACKKCHRAYQRKWNEKNYDKARAIQNDWKKNNRHKTIHAERLYWSTPEHMTKKALSRLKNRLKPYGLTVEQYSALLDAQNHACAICKTAPKGRRLAVDHCHKTGKVRGLLCTNCNMALGGLRDSLELLARCGEYLRVHQEAV